MQIVFTPTALRQWTKLSPSVRKRIDSKLTAFADARAGDVKQLKGRAGARLRVGDWRVIFVEQDDMIIVVAVGHRREVYE